MITEEMKSTLLDVEINNPEGIQQYFETIHLECQEISFNRGGTVIQKQEIPEL